MCYTTQVQTPFYASGFLYNLKTHQILLLQNKQNNDIEPCWSMLGGDSKDGEDAQITFQRVVSKQLDIDIKPKNIYPIYDYFHNTYNKVHYVFYAEVRNIKGLNGLKQGILSWFTFGEIQKLPFTKQTKQDIVVGERVINAKWRDDEAKKFPLTT